MTDYAADASLSDGQPGPKETLAFLLPSMRGGGAERVALRLMTSMAETGYRVELLLMRKEGELLDLVPPRVEIIDLKARRIRDAIVPLVRYLKERPPHAIQVRMWPLTIAALIARDLSRAHVRIVVSDHIALSKEYGGKPVTLALLKLTTGLFYPRADARIVVADGTADDLARLSGIDRSTIEVIYNPVPAPPAGTTSTADVEALWGAAEGRILAVGSLIPAKNHELLIRSFAQLRKRRSAKLMILGQGRLDGRLRELAAAEGVADDLILPGFALDPWPYYESANLFVLSSNYEGYPNVLLEAMRAGLTIVSTDCASGPREVLQDGHFGWLVPVGDEAALAKAMVEALDRPTGADLVRDRAEEISGSGTTERYLQLLLGRITVALSEGRVSATATTCHSGSCA